MIRVNQFGASQPVLENLIASRFHCCFFFIIVLGESQGPFTIVALCLAVVMWLHVSPYWSLIFVLFRLVHPISESHLNMQCRMFTL